MTILAEVYDLLNDYAPIWYSEELRDKLARTLREKRRTQAI